MSRYAYATPTVIGSALFGLALYVLGAFGLRDIAARSDASRDTVLGLVVMLFAAVAVHMLTYSAIRYRIPYFDPVLAVAAGCALARRAPGLERVGALTARSFP